jgi:DNA-binding NarL/FixJ family response regulator
VITVVLVDDHHATRVLLRQFIELDGRLAVVGEAATGREAIAVVGREHPDAVILDQEMPEMTGTQALPELVRILPPVIIVMYSSDPRIKTKEFALEAGAHAYFAKGDPVDDLLDAVVALTS